MKTGFYMGMAIMYIPMQRNYTLGSKRVLFSHTLCICLEELIFWIMQVLSCAIVGPYTKISNK